MAMDFMKKFADMKSDSSSKSMKNKMPDKKKKMGITTGPSKKFMLNKKLMTQ